ncbi:hypothetical protein EK21DRAFT_91236 [Setomelanomma holmii]|uniref:Uncharacterized protein n=1 Tax=Setomelanomma holmii TaxID=210430 RepID=A0A9P4LJK6_9PLEO|nr:hypothetical protein EK21DRAFT_91236 [Setomelanomma holmii]
MPIVGPVGSNSTANLTTVTGCIATVRVPAAGEEWWHSTVYETPFPQTTGTWNAPPLTTIYTPSPECVSRWLLGTNTCGNYTLYSVDSTRSAVLDPLYRSCQKYSTNLYSPGAGASTGSYTFWQGSCCRSGMTIGPEYPSACFSRFSTPFSAYARVTPPPLYSGATPTPVYEYSQSGSITSAISSITVVPSGSAIADPIVVAWQLDDLKSFPADYATSLARRVNITLLAASASSSASAGPGPTSAPGPDGLSTGAKAGIGVGVALGAVIGGIAVVLLCMRRRRKAGTTDESPHVVEMEDQDRHFKEHKWFFGGKWRSEVNSEPTQNELDSKAVHVVPGPPAELEAREPPTSNEGRIV